MTIHTRPDPGKPGFAVTTGPLKGSRKVYDAGQRFPELRVPGRAIEVEGEPLVRVYDPSGPYTDAEATIDISAGLPRPRDAWVRARGDVEEVDSVMPPLGKGGAVPAFPVSHRPLRAKPGKTATQLAYARPASSRRRWNSSPSARTSAARRRRRQARDGEDFGAPIPDFVTPEFVRDEIAARPRDHPGQHQPPEAGADDHRPQLPGQDQRQHRQLRGAVVDGRGGRQDGLGDPLGRRHGDGPLHRPQHPQHPRLDHPQFPGADRHRADLPGAGEGRRHRRGPDLGGLPRHADRAGRAGRRLFHHPCRRAAALHPADRQAASPASSRAAARSWPSGAWPITRRASSTSISRRSARSLAPTTSRSRSATACAPARSPTPTTPPSSPSWRRWAN